MPPRHPFFIGKNQVTFQDTIFLLLHALCVFLGASVVLVFLVCQFVLFAAINGWTPTNFLWRRCTSFHLQGMLQFSLLFKIEHSSFSATAFGFRFRLDLRSDLVISFHQGVFLPLIFIGFHQKRCFKKFQMVLEKRKNFMQKSSTRRSLCRLRLRLFHVMLDIFLIVCLVVLLQHGLSQITEIA